VTSLKASWHLRIRLFTHGPYVSFEVGCSYSRGIPRGQRDAFDLLRSLCLSRVESYHLHSSSHIRTYPARRDINPAESAKLRVQLGALKLEDVFLRANDVNTRSNTFDQLHSPISRLHILRIRSYFEATATIRKAAHSSDQA
jgi:hypothetical protein